ncbi:MAG: hypothetical protein WCE56_13405, partial [Desulfobacterales bacterium]
QKAPVRLPADDRLIICDVKSIRRCHLMEKMSDAPLSIWRKSEGKTLTPGRLWYTNMVPKFNPPVGEKIIVVLL